MPPAPPSPAGSGRPQPHTESDSPGKMFWMDIDSYSETKNMTNGSHIKSRKIETGGHNWHILYYPNGREPGTTESISLYLHLGAGDDNNDNDEIEAWYQFILSLPGGGIRFMSVRVHANFSRRRQNAHGFERFVTRDDLEKSGCFLNDHLRIRCDIAVVDRRKEPSVEAVPLLSGPPGTLGKLPPASNSRQEPSIDVAPPPPASVEPAVEMATLPDLLEDCSGDVVPLSGLKVDLGHLLLTKEGADVDFEVGGKVFAAHRCVLAARSPVFKSDFYGSTKEENTSYIRINGMNPEAFDALLHYMYTDSLLEMNIGELGSMAKHLLAAADLYGLKDLKLIVENKLCSHVCVTTALEMLVLAERHECWKLKKTCLESIASHKNASAVMATNSFEHLARSCPSVIRELVTNILDTRDTPRR